MKSIKPMKLFGLQISVAPLAYVGTLGVWVVFTLILCYGVNLPLTKSILMGLAGTLLHWISELIHCLGHAYAAKRTGYPMSGIRFGTLGILAQTQYPTDEVALPPSIHIRRALGGPLINGLLSILLFLILPLWPADWFWLGLIVLIENIFLYTLQVFLPVGFNDGSTILRNLRKKY